MSALKNFLMHHSGFCENKGRNPKYYPCTCKRDEATAEFTNLLEACEAALGLAEAMSEGDLYDKIKSAIAKAKGEK